MSRTDRARVIDSLFMLTGFLGRAGAQLLLLLLFARLGGPASAGEFALAFAVSTPVIAACELALRNVYQTLNGAPAFRVFFAFRLIVVGLGVGAVALVGALGALPVESSILLPLLLLKYADSVLDICFARLQVLDRIRRTAALLWVNTGLSVAAVVVVAVAGWAPEWAIVGSGVASVALCLTTAPALLTGAGRWFPTWDETKRIVAAGGTLGFAATLVSVLGYMPVWYLAAGAGTFALGIFAVCQYSVTLAALFYGSAVQSWLAELRRAFLSGGWDLLRRRGRRIGGFFFGISMLGGSVVFAGLPTAAPIVFGPEFQVSYVEAIPFALAVMLMGLETSLGLLVVVLNRYGTRVASAAVGLVACAGFCGVTLSGASVALAGYAIVVGLLGRTVTTAYNLRSAARRSVAQGDMRGTTDQVTSS